MKQMPQLDEGSAASTVSGALLTGEGSEEDLSAGRIIEALARNPDIGQFLATHPHLGLEDLKAALALGSAALLGTLADGAPHGIDAVVSIRSHGLPEPDGPMHQMSVFRSIIAPLKPGKLLDLGAEKRGFPLTAAHLGWQVTSVSAGADAMVDTDAEGDSNPDPDRAHLEERITWIRSGLDDFPFERGEYDLITIHGLLHRMDFHNQVTLFRRCAGTPLLIDARVADANTDRVGRYEGMVLRDHAGSLDDLGRDSPANAKNDSADERAAFMFTEESLIQLARDSGYPIVLITRPPYRRNSTYFLCLPKNWNAVSGGKGRAKRLERRDGSERAARSPS